MGRSIARNFGLLALGRVVGDLFLFGLVVAVSRVFGPDGMGQYSFAIGLTGFFAVFADFGLYPLTVKELSHENSDIRADFGRIFVLRLSLSILVLVSLAICTVIFSFPAVAGGVLIGVGIYQVMLRFMDGFAALFLAREDTHFAAVLEISLKAFASVSAFLLAVFAQANLALVVASLAIVASLHVLTAILVVSKRYGWPRITTSFGSLVATVKSATPYAGFILLAQISTRTDVVLLGFMLGSVAAGTYNAAYHLVFLFLFVAQFAANAILPHASRLRSRRERLSLYNSALNWIVLAALPASAILWLVAPDVVTLVFGRAFTDAAIVVRILSGLFLAGFVTRVMGVFLIACDLEGYRTRSQAWAAALNVSANAILIPVLGVVGAAVATLSSELLLAGLFAHRLSSAAGRPRIGSRLAIGIISTAAACLPFILIHGVHWAGKIGGATVIYVAILALFKDVREREFRTVFAVLRSEVPRAGATEVR